MTNDQKQSLYWTVGIMGVIVVLGYLAYALDLIAPAA
jgi:hypothetical protein